MCKRASSTLKKKEELKLMKAPGIALLSRRWLSAKLIGTVG
jgi:hypothetical protein